MGDLENKMNLFSRYFSGRFFGFRFRSLPTYVILGTYVYLYGFMSLYWVQWNVHFISFSRLLLCEAREYACEGMRVMIVLFSWWCKYLDIVIYLLSYLGMYLLIEQPNQEIDNTITRYYILSST